MPIFKNYFLFAILISITSATCASSMQNPIKTFNISTNTLGDITCDVYDETSAKNNNLEDKIYFAREELMHNIKNVATFQSMMNPNSTNPLVVAKVIDIPYDHPCANQPYPKSDGTTIPVKYIVAIATAHNIN